MIPYYYSEITKKFYKSETEAIKAEKEATEIEEKRRRDNEEKKQKAQKLQEERSMRVKKVEEAYILADETRKDADALLHKFLEDYGYSHLTTREFTPMFTIANWLESFFN